MLQARPPCCGNGENAGNRRRNDESGYRRARRPAAAGERSDRAVSHRTWAGIDSAEFVKGHPTDKYAKLTAARAQPDVCCGARVRLWRFPCHPFGSSASTRAIGSPCAIPDSGTITRPRVDEFVSPVIVVAHNFASMRIGVKEMDMKIDGRCHCGCVTYEAEIDPEKVLICHCGDCQT